MGIFHIIDILNWEYTNCIRVFENFQKGMQKSMHILLGHENCWKGGSMHILLGHEKVLYTCRASEPIHITISALYQDKNERLSTNQGKLMSVALSIAHEYLVNSFWSFLVVVIMLHFHHSCQSGRATIGNFTGLTVFVYTCHLGISWLGISFLGVSHTFFAGFVWRSIKRILNSSFVFFPLDIALPSQKNKNEITHLALAYINLLTVLMTWYHKMS